MQESLVADFLNGLQIMKNCVTTAVETALLGARLEELRS
jgi:hypothetical protein